MCRICLIEIDGQPQQHAWLSNIVYQLPDGSRASGIPSLAWCLRCRSFVCAERILSGDSIDSTIVELTIRPFSLETVFIYTDNDDFRERVAADFRRLCAWRALRKSPPKCITCGSEQIQDINDSVPFPHPEDGSECIAHEEWAFTGEEHRAILLDVEGNRIGETTYHLLAD